MIITQLIAKTADIPNGPIKQYDKEGQLSIYYMKNEELSKLERYYKSGKLLQQSNFEDQKQAGNDTWYFENGQINIIRPYKNGKIEGVQFPQSSGHKEEMVLI